MKNIILSVLIITSFFSCQSERELEVESVKEEAIDNFAEIKVELMLNQSLDQNEINQLSNKFSSILKDSAEIGLRFTQDLYGIIYDENFNAIDLMNYVKKYSIDGNNTFTYSTRNFNEFKYHLPNSELIFQVELTNIETVVKKDFFKIEKEKYAVPELKDGYLLKIACLIKNTDSKSHMIPTTFFGSITSMDGSAFSKSTEYGNPDRITQFMTNTTMNITNEEGKRPSEFSDGSCSNSSHCMKFEPGEERTIIFNFEEPIYIDVDKLIFSAFNLSWRSGKNTSPRPKGLIIDLKEKKVIGEHKY
jgi:hypothetical protein